MLLELLVAAAVAVPSPEPREAYAPAGLTGLTPLTDFVPFDARPDAAVRIPAAAGIPPQVLLEWERGGTNQWDRERALAVWEYRGGNSWRRIYSIHLPPGGYGRMGTALGDLTGDGHAEVLVSHENGGTGGCGPRRVLEPLKGRVRRLFYEESCDTGYRLGAHAFLVDRPAGRVLSHCCPPMTMHTLFRWNGTKLRPVASSLHFNCYEPGCERWSRKPLHFTPGKRVFWDARRGLAVGGARPWLLARTADGGRTWRILDAEVCPIGAPVKHGPGRAVVRFPPCAGSGSWLTDDYGVSWTLRP